MAMTVRKREAIGSDLMLCSAPQRGREDCKTSVETRVEFGVTALLIDVSC